MPFEYTHVYVGLLVYISFRLGRPIQKMHFYSRYNVIFFLRNDGVITIGKARWYINALFFSSFFSSFFSASFKFTLEYSANFHKTLRYSANLLSIATLKSMKINKISENQ